MESMLKDKIIALIFLLIGVGAVYILYHSIYINEESKDFKFGVDLAGGSRLTYIADTSTTPSEEIGESLKSLRDVIERRVNVLGVSEPIVRTSISGIVTGEQTEKLIVELPGITDIDEAIAAIGETPTLEFQILKQIGDQVDVRTILTGKELKRASIYYEQGHTGVPTGAIGVATVFDKEGTEILKRETTENVGETLIILLDGQIITTPVIGETIPNGEAVIRGGFEAEEAKELVRNLNFGALPLEIELENTETVSPSLGTDILEKGIFAGMIGFISIAIFFLIFYRLSGVIAVLSLIIYVSFMLLAFKSIPVILTAAGLAGFIITIGIAVDANILIFERVREEIIAGRETRDAIKVGMSRAWSSIRDGNFTSLIISILLYWLGTAIVKGFALTFIIGIIISIITAVIFTRFFLLMFSSMRRETFLKLMCRKV